MAWKGITAMMRFTFGVKQQLLVPIINRCVCLKQMLLDCFSGTVETKGLWSIKPEERRKYSKRLLFLPLCPHWYCACPHVHGDLCWSVCPGSPWQTCWRIWGCLRSRPTATPCGSPGRGLRHTCSAPCVRHCTLWPMRESSPQRRWRTKRLSL